MSCYIPCLVHSGGSQTTRCLWVLHSLTLQNVCEDTEIKVYGGFLIASYNSLTEDEAKTQVNLQTGIYVLLIIMLMFVLLYSDTLENHSF